MTYTLSKPGPPSGVIKNKVSPFVSALIGVEGFNRFGYFESAFSGADSSLSLSLPVISVIGVVEYLGG